LFGPDAMLYIGWRRRLGRRTRRTARRTTLARSRQLLRHRRGRAIRTRSLAGNPFLRGGGAKEIWALGRGNHRRFAFDRSAGLLYHRGRARQPARGKRSTCSRRARRPELRLAHHGGSRLRRTPNAMQLHRIRLPSLRVRHSQRTMRHHRRIRDTSWHPVSRARRGQSSTRTCRGMVRSLTYAGGRGDRQRAGVST